MNKKRTVLLSIGFLSLVIFAVIVMVMMYIKNNESHVAAEKRVAAYVAAKDIPLGKKIGLDDIELRSLPEDYVGSEPLAMADIVDHYTRIDITKSDLIRSEKLSTNVLAAHSSASDLNQSIEVNGSDEGVIHDRISFPLGVFQNPDSTLHTGERIDIIGISEYGEEKPQFAARYIALRVKVGGFMKDGKRVDKIASVIVDEKTQAATKVFADEILLEMPPQEISRFLTLYYRSQLLNNDRAHNPNNLYQGHIWMVKSSSVISRIEEAAKLKMMNGRIMSRPKTVMPASMPPLPQLISTPKGIVSYEQ